MVKIASEADNAGESKRFLQTKVATLDLCGAPGSRFTFPIELTFAGRQTRRVSLHRLLEDKGGN
jgi:hypothetical protein